MPAPGHEPPPDTLAAHWLADARAQLAKYRALGEAALAQVDDAAFFAATSPECNSIALLCKHLAGNQRSRWTEFLTTDGEKPSRRRDAEFEREPADSRASIMALWKAGWDLAATALASLTPADLLRTITIRGEPHTVLQAVQRQLTHYAYHVGQIVQLARDAAGPRWRSLSIPRGESARFEVSKEGRPYQA
ncbi:MAG: DUF1572 family protein [Planctomycetota bacterium]